MRDKDPCVHVLCTYLIDICEKISSTKSVLVIALCVSSEHGAEAQHVSLSLRKCTIITVKKL